MKYAIQWIRSFVFLVQMYVMMAVIGLLWAPWVMVDRRGAHHAAKSYCRWVFWTARWMVGIRTEVRGTAPTEECLVAAKHQSFLDVMMIFERLPRGKYIMKKSLVWAPVLGQYGLRMGCVPVDRGRRAEAIRKMKADVASGSKEPGQLIIYPQGSRIKPGVQAPYKVGARILYEQLEQPCYPVAVNVGLFWPRVGIYRTPGTAVIEYLPPIPPGLPAGEFQARLEREIEEGSNRLMKEAGFDPDAHGRDTHD